MTILIIGFVLWSLSLLIGGFIAGAICATEKSSNIYENILLSTINGIRSEGKQNKPIATMGS